MTLTKQTPETLAASGVRENDQAGQRVDREHSQIESWPQDRPIAYVMKNSRARFEIGLRSYDALRRVEIRLREMNGLGFYKETGPTMIMAPAKLREIIEGLEEAERACIEEGVLP